ncbi:MAG: fasciclin domain-containing protein, partial [Bacteroidota bacterium]|nr:fasciclin domain-containing protein [Bacteroidota bacterium]
MKLKNQLFLLVSLLAFLACEDPYKDSAYQVYNVNPVSTYLSKDSTFSEWVTILKYADMYNALNQADKDFTAFVPTNSAVRDFYQKMGVSGITELGKTYARSLVKYHTVLDTISVADFVQLSYTTNLSGDQLSIAIDPDDAGEAVLGGDAKVVEMGIHVSNGLIYVLGDVMKPLVETVYDRVAQNSSYTIFTKAIEQT